MSHTRLSIQLSAALLFGFAAGWFPCYADEGSIGLYGTVEGTVTVAHPGTLGKPVTVKVQEPVLFQDMIETRNESRTKALFDDDSILTVGENSKVQITEYIYNPNQNVRSAVVHLLEGRLRALVAKAFKGPGSKFEIHTPTAVAAARGTYFVVWSEGGASGMVNIGEEGRVDFTSAGKTVTVAPGQFSVALPGQGPSQPAVYQPAQDLTAKSGSAVTKTDDAKTTLVLANRVEDDVTGKNTKSDGTDSEHMKWAHKAVADTKVKDHLKQERPMDVLRALRHDAGATSRVLTKVGPDQQVGRLRDDRRIKDGNDNRSANGNGPDSENSNASGNTTEANADNGRGRGEGGNDANKEPVAKVGDVSGNHGNGEAVKGEKGQGGGEGSSNSNVNGNGNGNGDSARDRGRSDGNNDSPKVRHQVGDGSKVESTNSPGSGPGKIIPITPLSAPVVTAPPASPVGALPVALTPTVSSPVVSAPVASPMVTAPPTSPVAVSPVAPAPLVSAPVVSAPVALPVVTAPVMAPPVFGAPVTPTVPVATVMTPPAVISGASSAGLANGKGNGQGSSNGYGNSQGNGNGNGKGK